METPKNLSLTLTDRHPLETLRKRANINELAFCRAVNISRQHYKRIKYDYVANLSLRKAYMIASLLGLTVPQLIYCLERGKLIKDSELDTVNDSVSLYSDIVGKAK